MKITITGRSRGQEWLSFIDAHAEMQTGCTYVIKSRTDGCQEEESVVFVPPSSRGGRETVFFLADGTYLDVSKTRRRVAWITEVASMNVCT